MRPLDIVRPSKRYIEAKANDWERIMFLPPDESDRDRIIEQLKSKARAEAEQYRFAVGLITEGLNEYSVHWFGDYSTLYNAWWEEDDLEYIGNIPEVFVNAMAHPFGLNTHYGSLAYPPCQMNKEQITKE